MPQLKLNVKQAAARAGVSAALIYQWTIEGLPHYRLGGRGRRGKILIEEADLDAFLAARKVQPSLPVDESLRHITLP